MPTVSSLRGLVNARCVPRVLLLLFFLILMFSAVAVPSEPKFARVGTNLPVFPIKSTKSDGYGATAQRARLNNSPAAQLGDKAVLMPSGGGPLLSLRSACAAELSQHCPTTSSLRCLLGTWASLPAVQRGPPHVTATCAEWLVARDACFSALEHIGGILCRDAIHGRECLRRVPRALLPNQCVDSNYFRSVLLLDAMRR